MRRERRAETSSHFTEGKRCCAFTELLEFNATFDRGLFAHPIGRAVFLVKLPGSLLNAGDLTLVSQLAEADTADTVFTEVSMRSAADLASVVSTAGELGLSLLLENHCCLSHSSYPPIKRKTERRPASAVPCLLHQW